MIIFSVLVADIFGTNSLELIPAYLLIAETSIGLNKLREAEQQLQKGIEQKPSTASKSGPLVQGSFRTGQNQDD